MSDDRNEATENTDDNTPSIESQREEIFVLKSTIEELRIELDKVKNNQAGAEGKDEARGNPNGDDDSHVVQQNLLSKILTYFRWGEKK